VRRAARIDGNHAGIVGCLRACGVRVQSLAGVGDGVPDLLCLFRGRLFLVEVKNGQRKPSAQRLKPLQEKWHAEWADAPLYVATSVEDAVAIAAQQ
jgi:hypothetical protein